MIKGMVRIGLVLVLVAGCTPVDRNWFRQDLNVGERRETQEVQGALDKIKEDPSGENYYRLALAYLKEKRLGEAVRALGEALSADPQHVGALLLLSKLAAEKGDRQQVLRLAAGAVEEEPENSQLRATYGLVLLTFERYGEAEREFLKVLELEPNPPLFIYFHLTRCYGEQHQLEKAKEICQQGLQKFPQSSALRVALGNVYLSERKPNLALEQYHQATQLKPQDAQAWYALGRAYESIGQTESAVENYRKASQQAPTWTLPAKKIGQYYIRTGQLQKAFQHFQKMTETVSSPEEGYFGLGIVYQKRKQLDQAMEAYRRAVELDPGHALASNNLAYLYAEENIQLEQAFQLARKAVRLEPNIGSIHDTLGWVYFRQGEWKLAEEELRTAQSLDPRNAEAAYHLGLVLQQLGRREEAAEELRRVPHLSSDPDLLKKAEEALQSLSP